MDVLVQPITIFAGLVAVAAALWAGVRQGRGAQLAQAIEAQEATILALQVKLQGLDETVAALRSELDMWQSRAKEWEAGAARQVEAISLSGVCASASTCPSRVQPSG